MPGYVIQRDLRATDDQLGIGRKAFVKNIANGRLCTVMADVLAEDMRAFGTRLSQGDPAADLPWLMPVLGSGCLESPSASWVDPAELSRAVSATVATFTPAPTGSESWEKIASRFTMSLVENRRRNAATTKASEPQRIIEVAPLAARLVLIAALATRFCHVSRALGPSAIDRLADEVILRTADMKALDDPFQLDNTVIAPLRTQLNESISHLESLEARPTVDTAVLELLKTIRKGLNAVDGPSVTLNSVRLVTEAAWYELVADPDTYHGWSELLLGLILNGGAGPVPFRSRRPRFNRLDDASDKIRDLFERPTRTSWESALQNAQESERSDAELSVHTAIAHVLRAQSEVFEAHPDSVPTPVAFVTSFDLELEMALWRTGRPFRVAVPVHLLSEKSEREVELVWVVGDVTPDRRLPSDQAYERLTTPTNWHAMTDRSRFADGWPLVVRLTGSPLLDYAGLDAGTEDRIRLDRVLADAQVLVDTRRRAFPAVTVDEYLAMRQAEVEIYFAVQRRPDGTRRGPNLALVFPQGGGSRKNSNLLYWGLFGVPIGDPAVRQRLMSLLAMRWIASTSGPLDARESSEVIDNPEAVFTRGASSAPADLTISADDASNEVLPRTVVGVAVNYRLDQEEALLLSWLGLTVVHEQVKGFVGDLMDYAAHLRGGPEVQRLSSNECVLIAGGQNGRHT